MLALTRKQGETVVLTDERGEILATVSVSRIRGRYVGLAIDADTHLGILRGELQTDGLAEKLAVWKARKG
jgi:sRNA-binding carbon storage regulator CsrA